VSAISASTPEHAFNIRHYGPWASVLTDGSGREHVYLSDGSHRLQLDITKGSVLGGPVYLQFNLTGFQDLDQKLLSLRRLIALHRQRQFSAQLYPREVKAARWATALQAYDGHSAGASFREIAIVLYGQDRVVEDWNGRSDFLRLRVQRMIKYARSMVAGGYAAHLRSRGW
jgi:hypothetical protein